MTIREKIGEILEDGGGQIYGGECVSQLAHALQCASLAEDAGASPALITAALLHDIGHLVDKRFELGQTQDIDRRHEDIGAAFLTRWFGAEVTEPIRLHVRAKRYICSTEPQYLDTLSRASVRSLELQGGPLSDADAAAFLDMPFAREAVQLRKWDDLAKEPARRTPPLDHFLPYVVRAHATKAG